MDNNEPMRTRLKRICRSIILPVLDWTVLGLGSFTLLFLLSSHSSELAQSVGNKLTKVSGLLGFIYLAIHLFIVWRKRVVFDRILISEKLIKKVLCLVIMTPFIVLCIANFCSVGGDDIFSENNEFTFNTFWRVFFHFTDPGNQPSASSRGGAIIAALSAILGIFLLNGLLVSAIIGGLDRRKERWQNGEIRYKKRHLGRFAIVIGANEIVSTVIKRLLYVPAHGNVNNKCEHNNDYVILQTNRDPQNVRAELASRLTDDEMEKVIIYRGLRDSKEELKALYPMHSTEIYVLGESTLSDGGQPVDGGESFHDSLNMRCVNILAGIMTEDSDIISRPRLRCNVLFEYQTTYSVFQFSDVSEDIKKALEFVPFNRYDSWARQVMVNNRAFGGHDNKAIFYRPLDGDGIKSVDSDDHVHFVIVGMSKMGVAMGVQALLQSHYVNYAGAKNSCDKRCRRTRITFIDTNADKEMDFFKGRYENLFELACCRYGDANNPSDLMYLLDYDANWNDPMASGKWAHLSKSNENFIDVEVEFIKGSLESEGVRKFMNYISDNSNGSRIQTSRLTVAVCLKNTHQAVAAALYMPLKVYEKAQEIWVYQRESADIINNLTLANAKDLRYSALRPFGMLYTEYISGRDRYIKAMLVNRTYDKKSYDSLLNMKLSVGNVYSDIKKLWAELPLDKTFSNKYFVDSMSLKERNLDKDGYASDSWNKCEHNRWNVQQLLFGYMPCDFDEDAMFQVLNTARNTAATEAAKRIAKDEFKRVKENLKCACVRKHPNICDYDHLDDVDSEAKPYDEILNKAIPEINRIVYSYMTD